jgi:3-oxoadipate enol-lactonase
MPYAYLDDAQLYYRELGRGEPLLLLMGLGGSQDAWGTPFLSALDRDWRVLALDHRGAGRSTRGRAPYSIAQLADDAAAFLARLSLPRAHIFGLSMGGMVAQELALRHPQRVGGLILASTTCGGREAIWPGPDGRRRFLEGVDRTGSPLLTLLVAPRFVAEQRAVLQRRALRLLFSGTTPSVFREQARAIARFATYDRLPRIAAPTLVMAGDQDALIPSANAAILVRRIPGAEGAIVRGTGHVFVWEAPDRAAAEIARFLRARAPRLIAPETVAS